MRCCDWKIVRWLFRRGGVFLVIARELASG
jgi:hypothetical protein